MHRLAATPRARLTRALVSVGLLTLAPLAWAEVSQSLLEKAETLIKAGKAEEAYQMLEPLEVEGAGDAVYDNLLANAALESKRPSKATFVYERILAVEPNYLGVRADMGRAYYALGDLGRAKIEFETVLAGQGIPNDLRGTVEQYVRAIEQSAQNRATLKSGYVELGFGRDTNIGSAYNALSLTFPSGATYNPDKKGDNYATLGLGGEVNHTLNNRWGVFAGADYRGRAYQTYCDNTCNWALDGRAGVSYVGGAWQLRTGLTAGSYNLNQASFRDTVGATVDWRLTMDNSNQLSLGASVTRASYLVAGQQDQNTQTNALSAGWLTPLGDGSAVLNLNASAGVENAIAGRSDGDRRFFGPRITYQKSFNAEWGAYASTGLTYSKYSGINTLYLLQRDEVMVDVAVGLTWALRKGLSVRPQLVFIKNNSAGAELYTYDKVDGSVSARLDF